MGECRGARDYGAEEKFIVPIELCTLMKKCPRCGARNPDSALYCKECGAYLGDYLTEDISVEAPGIYQSQKVVTKDEKERWHIILSVIFLITVLWNLLVIGVLFTLILKSQNIDDFVFYWVCNIYLFISLILSVISIYYSLVKSNWAFLVFTSIMNIISIFNAPFGIIAMIILIIKKKEWVSQKS